MPSEIEQLRLQAGREVFINRPGGRSLAGPDGLLMPMRGKKVLVTGATGLIGSVIVSALKCFGDIKVVCADSRMDLGQALKVTADYVSHAAGYAQPAKFTKNPMETIDLNTNWTIKLARALPKNGRMIFLSSSEVYSGSPHQRHGVDDIGRTTPAHARAAYIEGKRCGEAVVHAARSMEKNVVAARVSLAYGPGVRRGDTRVVSEFITQALKTREIRMQDGGTARRTYCYVTDTVEMLLRILMVGREPVYNVGGQSDVTIIGLARKIAAMTGAEVKLPYLKRQITGPVGAPAHVTLDMGRTKQEFGKFDFVPIDQGLKATIAWHRALEGIDAEAPA